MVIDTQGGGRFATDKFAQWRNSAWEAVKPWSDFIWVLLLLSIYWSYNAYQHHQRMALIQSPRVNDFYFVDYHVIEPTSDDRFRYIPLKVIAIDNELITLKVGNIAHTTQVPPRDHVKFDLAMKRFYYRAETLKINIATLQNWAENGVIYDLARPQNIYINGWIVMRPSELRLN